MSPETDPSEVVRGFGNVIGDLFSALSEPRLKVICALKMSPDGLRWSELEARTEQRGGGLSKALRATISKSLVDKSVDDMYRLTGWGEMMFDFSLNTARYFAHTTKPPYMTRQEFRSLKRTTNSMLVFLKKNKFAERYGVRLP